MTKAVRKLPEQTPRVESGGLQFGRDIPGIYFTGENAAFCAEILERAAEACPDSTGILSMQLQSMADMLWSTKLNLFKAASIHGELTKLVFEEAMSVVNCAHESAKMKTFKTPAEALGYQSGQILMTLRSLRDNS